MRCGRCGASTTALAALRADLGAKLTMRVSLDHYTQALHEAERGANSWAKAIDGCRWLSDHGFRLAVAGRRLAGESEAAARAGYAALFAEQGLRVDAFDPAALVLFPGDGRDRRRARDQRGVLGPARRVARQR